MATSLGDGGCYNDAIDESTPPPFLICPLAFSDYGWREVATLQSLFHSTRQDDTWTLIAFLQHSAGHEI